MDDLASLPGLSWRPLSRTDGPLLTPLIAAIDDVDGEPFRQSAQEVAIWLNRPWIDPGRDGAVGLDRDGIARAYGLAELTPSLEPPARVRLAGGVHPQWRGRGIGRSVLAWTERSGRSILLGASAGVRPGGLDAPVDMIGFGVAEAAHSTAALAARAGYSALRWFSLMHRSLDDPLPALSIPPGLRLVGFDPHLSEPVRLAANEAFADHWGSQPRSAGTWQEWMSDPDLVPQWSFVALDRDHVAGYVLNCALRETWKAQGFQDGYTASLGVRRPWRGRGVAKALLAASMAAFREAGMTLASLDVDTENPTGAVGLYTGLGYVAGHRSAWFGKPAR